MIPAALSARPAPSVGAQVPKAIPEKPQQSEAVPTPTVPTVTPIKPAQTEAVQPPAAGASAAPLNKPSQAEVESTVSGWTQCSIFNSNSCQTCTPQFEAVPPPTATMVAPQEPPIFPQLGATTLGAAVGSEIGHTMEHGLNTLLNESSNKKTAATPAAQSSRQRYDSQDPCAMEIKEFLQCAYGKADLNVCAAFKEALRQCKVSANIEYKPTYS